MRILHIYKTSHPQTLGGVEQVIHHLAHESPNYDIRSDVLSLTKNKSRNIQYANYKIFQVHQNFEIASTPISWRVIFKLKKLLHSYDVIHYHYPWPFMDVMHLILNIKTPSVLTYHSDIVKQKYLLMLYRPLQNFFLRRINVIVATSPSYFYSSPILKIYKNKTQVITYGLDQNLLKNPSQQYIDKWFKKINSPFFLFVGVLRYYKGLQYLIEAAKGTNAKIVIAGEGPMGDALKLKVERLQLKNVIFLGSISDEDKAALLKLSLGFVFPSHERSEAFGIALLEAAMFGKPMISCEISTGTSFINQHGETGLVVPPKNPMALSLAMNTLLKNPNMCKKMGHKAKSRYQSIFTIEAMMKNYVKLYRSLV